MELSTTMPMHMAMPPKLIMFKVVPKMFISRKTVSTQKGMDREMVTVAPPRRRKASTTAADRTTPRMMFWMALFATWRIYSPAS